MTCSSKVSTLFCAVISVCSLAAAGTVAQQASVAAEAADLPRWAYPVLPAAIASAPVNVAAPQEAAQPDVMEHVAGSKAEYPAKQIPLLTVVPDWFPDDHPLMPQVVAHGRPPDGRLRALPSAHGYGPA